MAGLVDGLVTEGVLGQQWRAAFLAVPREVFIPEVICGVVTPDGVAHFLEVNVAPGLTETSLLPMAIESDGAELGTVFAKLVERAVARG
jgi:hypothetical protein